MFLNVVQLKALRILKTNEKHWRSMNRRFVMKNVIISCKMCIILAAPYLLKANVDSFGKMRRWLLGIVHFE